MSKAPGMPAESAAPNFIRHIIDADLAGGKHKSIVTRFPPEPNGYLHIGHAKSICLNFGLAEDYHGQCNLRFDDTNPEKESQEYAGAIEEDVRWLGFQWTGEVHYASDYFETLYDCAVRLIKAGKAFVCDLTPEEMRSYRGTLTTPGKNSPYRDRSIDENLDLFTRMRAGEFADGSKVLRLKIDMASPNINLRDPVIYRIRRAHHIRTEDKWCIYPMYDYTHCISDALENITHSLCTLEFEDHRPLYDWILDQLPELGHPRQYEFSRLELQYTVTSKRKLNQLVSEKLVQGWDDPRMPTIVGMRRRGYTPASIRLFAKRIGVSKSENNVDMGVLESAVREDLENQAPRVMAVINPLQVTITNFVPGETASREAAFHPQRPELGSRLVPFTQSIWIERDDFAEIPPEGWQRLVPGGEVRLRYSYVMRCDEVIRDAAGAVCELKCSIDPATLGKNPQGRKVRGVIHWVSAEHALPAEVRLYDRLFTEARPDMHKDGAGNEIDFKTFLNPHSLRVVSAWVEAALQEAKAEDRYQFERIGYFCADRIEHRADRLVFNRTVTLKDTWQKDA